MTQVQLQEVFLGDGVITLIGHGANPVVGVGGGGGEGGGGGGEGEGSRRTRCTDVPGITTTTTTTTTTTHLFRSSRNTLSFFNFAHPKGITVRRLLLKMRV